MRLSGSQVKEIRKALMSAFPTPEKLRIMLREELDILPPDVPNSADYNEIISKLIEKFESENCIEKLIEGACSANPDNEELKSLKKRQYQRFYDYIGAPVKPDNFIKEQWKSLCLIISKIELKLLAQVCSATLENNSKIPDVLGNYPELSKLEDLDTLKTILLKCPDNDEGVPTIIKFAEHLAKKDEVKETNRSQLNDWVQRVAQELKLKLPTYKYPDAKPSGTAESYLLIAVRDKGSNQVSVEAELIRDYNSNDNDIKKPKKIDLDSAGNLECYFNKLPEIIHQFIAKSEEEYLAPPYKLTIELFLPLKYLASSIELEEIPIGLGNERKPIGNQYRFTIRSLERTSGKHHNELFLRWNCLTCLQGDSSTGRRKQVKSYIDYIHQINNCNWEFLVNDWIRQKKLGVKIICGLPESDEEKQKLLAYILKGGVPLALWLRSSNLPQTEQDKFKKIVKLEHLKDLSKLFEVVWHHRQDAHAKTENAMNYLGYHLGILCDNPHRIPYHLGPKSRKLRETGT